MYIIKTHAYMRFGIHSTISLFYIFFSKKTYSLVTTHTKLLNTKQTFFF